jgi:metal-responsive CopG/Arc/MetJ family transcriptional regulator
MYIVFVGYKWGRKMPTGNYRGVSLKEELVNRIERLIQRLGTYKTIAEFVSEAVRLRIEALEKQIQRAGGNMD